MVSFFLFLTDCTQNSDLQVHPCCCMLVFNADIYGHSPSFCGLVWGQKFELIGRGTRKQPRWPGGPSGVALPVGRVLYHR